MKMLKRTLAFICIIATVLNFSAVPIFADGTSSNSAFPIEIFEDLASLVNLDRVQKQPADGVDASAFDNDTSTSVYWTAQWWYDLGEWNYVWEMKEPVRLYGYSFEALNPGSYEYRTREEACTWRLYGSDSFGTKGKLISSVGGVKHTEGMTEVYPITDPTPYKYYYLDIVWTDGLNDEYFDEMSIGEIHLYGNPKAHDHSPYLTFVPAIAATTETEGQSAHYACACGKLFKDAEGKNEITDLSSIVIPKRNPTATGQVVVKADDGTFKVDRVPAGIDVTKPISKDNWGESVIHVDKDTDNASIWAHNATPDVSEMDVYLRWDDKYVYIGVVSPDPDPRG
ncbi:MAG: hypothetical protein PUE85_03560, partial [Firmicutes bacterium]|nr:hypothetical protein [Bacillota bacterium]